VETRPATDGTPGWPAGSSRISPGRGCSATHTYLWSAGSSGVHLSDEMSIFPDIGDILWNAVRARVPCLRLPRRNHRVPNLNTSRDCLQLSRTSHVHVCVMLRKICIQYSKSIGYFVISSANLDAIFHRC